MLLFLFEQKIKLEPQKVDHYIEGNAKKSTKSFLVQAEFIRFRQNFDK